MKKSIFDIHLMEGPITGSSKGENCTNSSHFSHWSKGLLIIDTILLIIPKSNKPSLVTVQTSIRLDFD